MAQTVVGFFDDDKAAQRAVDNLTAEGFLRDQIDISYGNEKDSNQVSHKRNDDNGITRFFKSLFGDNDEAERYTKVGRSGCSIVTVHAQSTDEAQRAADLLDDYGAIDVDERVASTGYRATGDDVVDRDRGTEREASIERVREDINISKDKEDRGGVRVRSRIVEQPVEENIRLREEHVRVERNPVDRVASDNELQSFREGEIELTERREIPVVNKEARVVEEIRLHKEVEEHDETIYDKVRDTEVDIDKLDESELNNSDGDYNRSNELTYDWGNKNNITNEGSYNVNDQNDFTDKDREDWRDRPSRRDGDPLFGA